ncbi:cobalt ECF transporter T component CbiQ [Roseofilum casamattae]|uniref:Cobalt ECF transporter T component CbiQ n=1 Tax=Roseofilum casamattae BLCC-M143 TaxID=3022442 RepID=A0ABT7BTJ5_9CYAN|nr:cobalt ECF transporter T component CbiQ [Roseofilum casamattae]MDJ1182505.1 cobalt ECF transporter T component CbiQ [Roseofilum casamattae BLCC-M143]
MKLAFDTYAHLNSPLHRWEPRCKLIGLMGLILAFATLQSLWLVPVMFAITLGLYLASKLPWSFVMQRLRYPGFFLLGTIAVLPFVVGETVLWEWGIISVYLEGCLAVILIAFRFVCIFVIASILFGTAPFSTMIKAMGKLGLPAVLGDMMLLTYRYLTELSDRLRIMKIAMRLRGFDTEHFRWRQLQVLAALAGTLLVRSYEQSERVYDAMRLRGYGQRRERLNSTASIRRSDLIGTGFMLLLAFSLAIA